MNKTTLYTRSVFLAAAMSVASCAPAAHETAKANGPPVSSPTPATSPLVTIHPADEMGKHWVQNDQLRTLMKELGDKTQRNWPKGVPQDPEDQQTGDLRTAMDSAVKLADGLAAAAVRIPASVTDAKMSEADRAGFQAEANILRDQAFRLGQAAREKKVEQMQRSLDTISATCVSCHSRYRDFSGQLNVQQASAE